jgi:Tol biopolymer transport system component
MALQPGTRLGPYQVESAIGAGGMGEVYKATDTRLNRTVALKVLPPHFADDPDMRQRFEREAQTIAGLNHPHICTLHDVGEQDGTRFIVMEYVEGETLADRLTRGPLPIDEALQVAGEIVDALDRAHQQGVVHRDLKPANIMLARSGATRQGLSQTKLLDFGLAKWAATDQAGLSSTQPTRMDVTAQGTILGTLQYMAPEQVEGKEADARTDVFAFGAVLYEMLTGKKAFEGKSQASLIGAIMKAEPRPLSHTQPLTPAPLEHIVERCLVKDPEERWQDAHSVKLKLQWIVRARSGAATAVEAPRRRWLDVAVMTTIAVLLAAVSVPAYLYWRGAAEPEAVQFRHTISGLSEADFAVSPDGRTMAFVAKPDASGAASLYIRPVGAVASVKLAGTDNATQPFWSPDNLFIAYVSGGNKLKKVPASGGASQDVCDAPDASGGAWSPTQGGTIVFGSPKGLFTISAEGGKAAPLTELAQGETGHLWPSFLPDGRHVVYLAWSEDAATRALFVGTLDSKERTRLAAMESNPIYAASAASGAAPGYLFFHRTTTLFAQPFDAKGLRFTGDPVHVADEVSSSKNGHGNFSVSQNGVLLYFQGVGAASTTGRGRTGQEQFGWVDRTGGRGGGALDAGSYGDMDLSPDGKLIAITKQEAGAPTADIWVIDWEKVVPHRVTSDAGDAVDPVWSPDGVRIAFTSWRKGNADVYVKNANGVGEETPLLESPANESVEDWSRDGKYIAFEFGKDDFQDIYALPLDGIKPGKPFPVVQGHYQKNEPQFSKDGKWLAYTSDENEPGKFQVYVISFPAGDLKQQVSTEGGGQPRWDWNGKKLYYRTLDNRYMELDLKLGAKIEASSPRVAGASPTTVPSSGDPTRHMWSVGADGRFLLRVPVGSSSVGGGASPVFNPTFTPAGQGSAAASTRSGTTSGLTAVLHWTSSLPKGKQ